MKSLREEIQSAIQSQTLGTAATASASSTEAIEIMRRASDGQLTGAELARMIDHTLLKPDAKRGEFQKLCEEALAHGFASVCVNSGRLAEVVEYLGIGARTLPIAVVGFPLGMMDTDAKAYETRRALTLGAKEIDMVIPIGKLKDEDFDAVYADIAAVVKAAEKIPVKVILETGLLSQDEKIAGCVIAKRAGAAFVKTATGFSNGIDGAGGSATESDIRLMRKVVGPDLGVKASGGIRTREDALKMIAAGANRIGASASVAIATATPSVEKGSY